MIDQMRARYAKLGLVPPREPLHVPRREQRAELGMSSLPRDEYRPPFAHLQHLAPAPVPTRDVRELRISPRSVLLVGTGAALAVALHMQPYARAGALEADAPEATLEHTRMAAAAAAPPDRVEVGVRVEMGVALVARLGTLYTHITGEPPPHALCPRRSAMQQGYTALTVLDLYLLLDKEDKGFVDDLARQLPTADGGPHPCARVSTSDPRIKDAILGRFFDLDVPALR
ncbi:hypothetical protein KFE25_009153 [Diacronema lutheri]|uniref:Uncharacterized protein n=1 Tax=Diacronema lutheri TaxID=2081491 RepID=A0A8J5XYC3_DIALT|nr:hypothetical protein KFE25_009153 [Diacronema lutheri]